MPGGDSCPESQLVVWDLLFYLLGAQSEADNSRYLGWDGRKWRMSRFAFCSPLIVMLSLECKFHKNTCFKNIITCLKHIEECLAYNRLLASPHPCLVPSYSGLGMQSDSFEILPIG